MMSPKTLRYNSELYERIRVLGKGSFGTAVVHRRRTDCALVVLKEIDLSRFGDEHRRQAALQEARIMSELSHENIINYYNAYTTDTKLIIEMEYARIGTLQSYLADQSQPPAEEEALDIFRQIVAGLDYLHAKQIVHLDLKMGNIFISAEGTIKLGDFGIAQFMAADSSKSATLSNPPNPVGAAPRIAGSNGRQLGTLAYSSPERCLGLPTDYQSDIWSLGCILYELITLRPLFPSESLAELVTNITQVKYQPIELMNQHISPLTVQMFEQMIAKDPSERPSASELSQLTEQSLARLEAERNRQTSLSAKRGHRQQSRVDLSTEAANLAHERRNILNHIKYPHSLVYQVRLDQQNVRLDRLNLPQSKRIKQIVKGASHYLALTYDNIVYGWGSRNCGQLGSSSLILSCRQMGRNRELDRKSRSARNSFTARGSAKTTPWPRPLTQVVSLTQPPSLASSTQTLEVPSEQAASATLDYESILRNSPPASKPFIINELNKRKIERVAAGNNFSVFLSKTGIVMTCGDGSAGCLGRGDLASSLSPRMVDDLLSMDVVSVASGPEHVVAVCGNGQAFSWGNIGAGRLGLGDERALNERLMYSKLNALERGKYVTLPQLVRFPNYGPINGSKRASEGVSIVAAFCGDRSTVFIDSNYTCWACGENRHNKLGLDVRRQFKRTVVVNYSWRPTRVACLAKYKIVSCCIGPNHSSFLTNEGKILVLGQDIDHSYRLKCDMMDNRETRRRILAELQEHGRRQAKNSNCFKRKHRPTARSAQIDRELLAQSLLANDQLLQFKNEKPTDQSNDFPEIKYPKMKASRFQRQQIESYLKVSRGLRRMPFDCALALSCTSKFTLILNSDNRVYFWGTRSYRRDNCCPDAQKSGELKCVEEAPSLQIVPADRDECFIKISGTNSTLMNNIELLGSDQPILHAQDPPLIANSLADLWILDYRPSISPASSSTILRGNSSTLTRSSSSSSDASLSDSFSSQKATKKRTQHECYKHDTILEPQPIVSLYVPSMFNHSGCALRLINLFCYDEDQFFLVLDTTITMQQQQQSHSTPHQSNPPSPTSAAPRTNASRASHQSPRLQVARAQLSSQSRRALNHPNDSHEVQQAATRLNMVEESRSQSKSDGQSDQWRQGRHASCHPFLLGDSKGAEQPTDQTSTRRATKDVDSKSRTSDQVTPECCRLADVENEFNAQSASFAEGSTTNSNSATTPATPMSPVSQNGFSLEEPRSMSTFLANNIFLGPSMNSFGGRLRRLDFEHREPQDGDGSFAALKMLARQQRRHRSMVNLSESNGATCDDFDETTSMPTWVKNEFFQHQALNVASEQIREHEEDYSSVASTEVQSGSESELTESSSITGFRSALSIGSQSRPTDDECSSSSLIPSTSFAAHQSTLVGSRDRREDLNQSQPLASEDSEFRDDIRISALSAVSTGQITGSGGERAAQGERSRMRSFSMSQPDLSVGQRGRSLTRRTVETTSPLTCDNIINCCVYKAASRRQAENNRGSLRQPHGLDVCDSQEIGMRPIERSQSKASELNSAQISLASYNTNTVRKEQRLDNLLAPPPSTSRPRSMTNVFVKVGEQYSSSCVDMRDTGAELTMIEMLDRSAGAQVLAARPMNNQRQHLFAEKSKTTSRWRQAINGLSRSQNFSCSGTKRSHSLYSIRKSFTRIFC